MILRQRPERVVALLEKEGEILEVIREKIACSSMEVDILLKRPNLLETMRTIHAMEAKGLLERVRVNGRKLFRVKISKQRVKVMKRERMINQ